MKKHEVFAEFFTNLLTLENKIEAREIAKKAWPATSDMWLHVMKIDPVLIELDLARVMDDGRIGYRVPDQVRGGPGWEIEKPTPEQEWEMRDMAEKMLRENEARDPLLVLDSGSTTKWSKLKELVRGMPGSHPWSRATFRIGGDANQIEFHLGPDSFLDSYALAWTTPAEREGGTFLDNRVRSSEPDDFLSRIKGLISNG